MRDLSSLRCALNIDVDEISRRFQDMDEFNGEDESHINSELHEFERCRLADFNVEDIEI